MPVAAAEFVAYPFLEEASSYLRALGVGIPELATDVAYGRSRVRGHERVLQALATHDITTPLVTSEADAATEFLAYLVSRILVSAVDDRFLVRRYAVSEARRIARALEREPVERLVEIAGRLHVPATEVGGRVAVPLASYLRTTAQIRQQEWKVVNQDLSAGRVMLPKDRFARTLEEVLRRRYEQELPLRVGPEVAAGFKAPIDDLVRRLAEQKKELGDESFGPVDAALFPPCMRGILSEMGRSVNVPHMGRFAIVSFLHKLGLNSEEILKFFQTVPDFDVEKSRYQIEHITGKISHTEYTPPSCSTMKTHGICPGEDELCAQDWMNHPLTYYRAKARAKAKGRPWVTTDPVPEVEAVPAAAVNAKAAEARAPPKTGADPPKALPPTAGRP